MTANGSWGGTYFSHPFDNDNTDNSFRINNSVKYQSANYGGFTFGGLYGFSNAADGFATNRAYSAGMQYANGPFKVAAAYLQTQATNRQQQAVRSPMTLDANHVVVGLVPSQTSAHVRCWRKLLGGRIDVRRRVDAIALPVRRRATVVVRFNNYELNARYSVTPALALGGAYTYTDLKGYAPGERNSDHVKYHQFGLQADYSLSKRTDFYAEGVVQLTGSDGRIANIYGAAPSSSGNQVVVSTGIRHRF